MKGRVVDVQWQNRCFQTKREQKVCENEWMNEWKRDVLRSLVDRPEKHTLKQVTGPRSLGVWCGSVCGVYAVLWRQLGQGQEYANWFQEKSAYPSSHPTHSPYHPSTHPIDSVTQSNVVQYVWDNIMLLQVRCFFR